MGKGYDTEKMIVFAQLYYAFFEEYLTSLTKEEPLDKGVIGFFSKDNLNASDEIFVELTERVNDPVFRLARVGQQVIHHSFWSGEFSFDDLEDGVNTYQKQLLMSLDAVEEKQGEGGKRSLLGKINVKEMRNFFLDGYTSRTYHQVLSGFSMPLNTYLKETKGDVLAKDNVVSLSDYRSSKGNYR